MREFDIAVGNAPQGPEQLVVQSLLREAWGHLRGEDWDQAERVLSAALGRLPEHPGCLAAMAICLAEGQRRFLSAEKLARKAVKVAPRDPEGCYALGVVYARGGRLPDARRWLQRADRLAGGHSRAATALAELGSGRPSPLRALGGAAVMATTAVAAVTGAAAAAAAAATAAATGAPARRSRGSGGPGGSRGSRGRRPALVFSLVMVVGVWAALGLYGQEVAQKESEAARWQMLSHVQAAERDRASRRAPQAPARARAKTPSTTIRVQSSNVPPSGPRPEPMS